MRISAIEVDITCRFVGFHYYPGSKTRYLRDVHRHLFNVRVAVLVEGLNRDTEFHQMKYDVEVAIQKLDMFTEATAKTLSCEQIAEFIGEELDNTGPYAISYVSVDEDGENGATVHFDS